MYVMADVQQLLKEYLREVIVWRQLKHPNILPCLGLYYLDNSPERMCLVSPWMDNGNLTDFLKDHPRESVDRILIMYDVANGLSYLHGSKIIHGDLKGVNILITPSRRACLADFGLSRVADSQVFKISPSSAHTTGTVRWLAPEVHRGMNTSLESDIYAYGCGDLIDIIPPGTIHAAPDWEEMSLTIWNNVKHQPLSEDVVHLLSKLREEQAVSQWGIL
ncbi:hypothetical protein MPER_09873 [Moniliophthora perniciosa FA553]|nr:hypothetical protein MPER_09873 [Moniliophthora perniciosa FA553]